MNPEFKTPGHHPLIVRIGYQSTRLQQSYEKVGGDRQKWNQLKNPEFKTIQVFLGGFGLKLGAVEKNSA